jgi:hypothetical protein
VTVQDDLATRQNAALLQQRANALVDDPALHRVIADDTGGWVEIRADYLDALLSLAERRGARLQQADKLAEMLRDELRNEGISWDTVNDALAEWDGDAA